MNLSHPKKGGSLWIIYERANGALETNRQLSAENLVDKKKVGNAMLLMNLGPIGLLGMMSNLAN